MSEWIDSPTDETLDEYIVRQEENERHAAAQSEAQRRFAGQLQNVLGSRDPSSIEGQQLLANYAEQMKWSTSFRPMSTSYVPYPNKSW